MIRTEALTWVVSWTLMLAVGLATALYLVGCETASEAPAAAPTLATPSIEEIEPRSESELAAETRALADRLTAATQGLTSDPGADVFENPFAGAEPWPEPSREPTPKNTPAAPVLATPAPAEVAWVNDTAEPVLTYDPVQGGLEVPKESESVAVAEPKPLTRQELIAKISKQISTSEDPALVKAVTAAALTLASTEHKALDESLLEPLKPMQREAVERLHNLFLGIQEQALKVGSGSSQASLSSGGGGFDRKLIDQVVADAFGEMPVGIVHADLCRNVAGFGVFEPLDSHTFLTGKANRAIVYVEVENFATATVEEDQREVRLSQELILYKEDDGLAVWRHEPTEIVDVSRNRRRDFYVVQMITLPARLGEGRYRLKVRITDRHGGSVDETTMKLNVVADVGLLGSAEADAR